MTKTKQCPFQHIFSTIAKLGSIPSAQNKSRQRVTLAASIKSGGQGTPKSPLSQPLLLAQLVMLTACGTGS